MGCLESDKEDEPLIAHYNPNPSISINEGKQNDYKTNNKNPFACITIKSMNNGNGKSEKENNNESKLKSIDLEGDIQDNINIFAKLKTLDDNDENEENALVKNCKTLFEYAYKKIDISDINNINTQKTLKEVDVMKTIDHPNIIKLYSATVSSDNKSIEILTEFVENGTLQDKLESRKVQNRHLEEHFLLDWLSQLCVALKYLHNEKKNIA